MKYTILLMVTVCIVLTSVLVVLAAPIDVPMLLREPAKTEFFTIEGEGDFISERDLQSRQLQFAGQMEVDIYSLKIGYTRGGTFNVYGMLGQAQDMKASFVYSGENFSLDYDNTILYGVGASGILHEFKDTGMVFFADGMFRLADRLKYTSVSIDGTKYFSDDFDYLSKPKFTEWQIAFGVSQKIGFVVPYGGVKYSDVRLESAGELDGTYYEVRSEARKNFGIFLGCGWLMEDKAHYFFEMRFADEQALSFKFGANF